MNRLIVSTLCVLGLLVSSGQVIAQQANGREPVTNSSVEQTFDGRVVADERVDIRNNTNHELAIIWIEEEGTRVEKGGLLARLDASPLEEYVLQANVNLRMTKAKLLKSESELRSIEIAMETLERELRARLTLIDSRGDMMFSKNGELAVKRGQLESTILVETERSKLLQKKLSQFDADKQNEDLACLELKLQLVESQNKSKVATTELLHLNEVFEKHERLKLEVEKEMAKVEGKRNLAEAEFSMVEAKADVSALRAELQFAEAECERLADEVQRCSVFASESGVVHHADPNPGSRFTDFVIEEGAMVRPGQSILYLPNLNSLSVEFEVPASVVNRIKIGQRVAISVDDGSANLAAEVSHVSNWPSPSEWLDKGAETYRVVVRIAEPDRVKIGQMVEVELKLTDN